jgi:hypothetical protein
LFAICGSSEKVADSCIRNLRSVRREELALFFSEAATKLSTHCQDTIRL